ncbi:MAG TPA: C13 family peptidase [Caulobacteraceae bacterium]
MGRIVLLLAVLIAWTAAPAAAAPGAFADWAAVVVSGDNRAAHEDVPTQAFDNARREIAAALAGRGFSSGNIIQFSVEPRRHPDTAPGRADLPAIAAGLRRLAARTRAGCLFYLTSHGSPDGAVLGERILPPRALARIIDDSCGARPTVVVISACFSGVFIPALAGPDRLILTAARRDRSSFGCGESDAHPFYDGCILAALPHAADFLAMGEEARACVARRERAERLAPPSLPQIAIGARFRSPAFAAKRAP